MDEEIYQMSFTESLLVLFVLALWLLAVIHLARKLEKICNPPSTRAVYSIRTTMQSNRSIEPKHSPTSVTSGQIKSNPSMTRCTSEPVFDPDRSFTVTLSHFPSEKCLPVRLSICPHQSSSTVIDLHPSKTELFQLQNNLPKPFVYPKRLPSIVRRSLLDLHRRALSQTSNPRSLARIDDEFEESGMVITSTRVPLVKRIYRRANAIDQDDSQRSDPNNQSESQQSND